jgi:protein SCO1
MSRRRLILWLLPLVLIACSKGTTPWHSPAISGVMPDLAFHLTDDSGRAVTAADYSGKVTLLYFGFTHCQDVCPETLTLLASAIRRLGDDANKVQVLFVSVDPKRDTPAVLHRYAAYFSPGIVGLTGTDPQLQTLSKRYRVSYSYGKPDAKGNYEVYHSSAIFAFDARGKIRLLMNQKESAAAIAADLKRLIAS